MKPSPAVLCLLALLPCCKKPAQTTEQPSAELKHLAAVDPFAPHPAFVGPPKPIILEDVTPTKALLAQFNEASLQDAKFTDIECYRLLWLRTFHNPVCLRLDHSPAGAMLTVKRWSGKGGYAWGSIAEEKRVHLTQAEFGTFLKLLNDSGFWSAPFDQPGAEGTDGASWVLEGRSKAIYRALDRPNAKYYDPAIAKPWLWLVKHSALAFQAEEDIY